MGLIKGITDAVIQKAKNEMKEYILKVMEEENNESEETELTEEEQVAEAEEGSNIENSENDDEPEEEIEEEDEEEEEEEILSLIDEEIIRLTFKTRPEVVTIPKEILETLQFLSVEEFAVYLKLFIFCCDQKKNYGYIGNTLRKKSGLNDMEPDIFEKTVERLSKMGLIKVEDVSDNQRTFVLYIPFNEEINTKAETHQKSAKPAHGKDRNRYDNRKSNNRKGKPQQQKQKEDPPRKEEPQKPIDNKLPGIAVAGNEDEDLYKSYRTYVNLEIDKAKMRVGRSNFDKIYMEAVKYIDKNFGFKVLSDSDKFKEYLTSYYISAFDIKTFEEWKKDKP